VLNLVEFAPRLVAWQKLYGRHDLPWQAEEGLRPAAYHVWLSEVMLQQTQVITVIAYFERFLSRFPTIDELAAAPLDDVLALWSGLGYYSRARNLHRAAQQVVEQFDGVFPDELAQLITLPGIGRSTAAAIAALAYGKRAAIMDGNVKRVLSRIYAIDGHNMMANEKVLWEYADSLAPAINIESYTQGMMDLGATLCTRTKPRCHDCPFERDCVAHQRGEEQSFPRKKPAMKEGEQAVHQRASQRRSKQAVMLLVYQQDQLLLERRPMSGIWGGLWSAPEFDSIELALAEAARLGLVVEQHIGIETKHSFTHFDLYATPLYVRLQEHKPQCEEAAQKWVTRGEALEMGIPALLRKWLLSDAG
jgi:A/G-specific adenine glycosylase